MTTIRTLSKALSNTSSSSTDLSPPSPRALTYSKIHALAARLSDSKKVLLDTIPHQRQKLVRLQTRAKSLLSSPVLDRSPFQRQNTTDEV